MEKFSNVDILAALDAIMRQNTGFYQDQFQNDRQTITEAAASPAKDDKTLLWVSAPAGTCCETEKDLLIRENVEYGRFRVFAEGVRLDGDKVQDEAQRIACEFARLWNPNGGDGRFMVKISEIFLNIATKDEVNQLAAALPYKSLTFATRRDGCPGLFAFVGKEENRGEIARRMILGERPEPEARKKPPHKAGPERS